MQLYQQLVTENATVHKILGTVSQNGVPISFDPVQPVPMLVGGVSKSFKDNCLVIGDAAGLVNPVTGYGIHYAMESAEIAAKTVAVAFANNRFDEDALMVYQQYWRHTIGNRMDSSASVATLFARIPSVQRATMSVARARGNEMTEQLWQLLNGNRNAYLWFARPNVLFFVFIELCKEALGRRK